MAKKPESESFMDMFSNFGRDLKMFLGTGPAARRVDRRVLARLLGAMY